MVISLSHHCLVPSSLSASSSFTRERMSSKPAKQPASKSKTISKPVPSSRPGVRLDIPMSTMAPAACNNGAAPAKCLPRLQETVRGAGEAKRPRRVVVMRRSVDGSCHSSGSSSVVELPGINTSRRHSISGSMRGLHDANLEVFVSPVRTRRSSVGDAPSICSSSFRSRDRPVLFQRSGPGTTTPIPPQSPRATDACPAERNNNNHVVTARNGYPSSRHFELTLQKIEETRHEDNGGLPSRLRRKNAIVPAAPGNRQYLGGEDFQEFRSSVEGRRFANISEMPIEYTEELLSQQEGHIGIPEETEDQQIQQKCLKWLETLPQS